jgi:hypothetical protein
MDRCTELGSRSQALLGALRQRLNCTARADRAAPPLHELAAEAERLARERQAIAQSPQLSRDAARRTTSSRSVSNVNWSPKKLGDPCERVPPSERWVGRAWGREPPRERHSFRTNLLAVFAVAREDAVVLDQVAAQRRTNRSSGEGSCPVVRARKTRLPAGRQPLLRRLISGSGP